jgi:monoamine oxidase
MQGDEGFRAVLVAFILGQSARKWGEAPQEQRRQAVLQHLHTLFRSELALQPLGFVEQDWYVPPNGASACERLVQAGKMRSA